MEELCKCGWSGNLADVSLERYKSALIMDKVARDWHQDEMFGLFMDERHQLTDWLPIQDSHSRFLSSMILQSRTGSPYLRFEVRPIDSQGMLCFPCQRHER